VPTPLHHRSGGNAFGVATGYRHARLRRARSNWGCRSPHNAAPCQRTTRRLVNAQHGALPTQNTALCQRTTRCLVNAPRGALPANGARNPAT